MGTGTNVGSSDAALIGYLIPYPRSNIRSPEPCIIIQEKELGKCLDGIAPPWHNYLINKTRRAIATHEKGMQS